MTIIRHRRLSIYGISLIEVMLSVLAASVVLTGVYKSYITFEKRRHEEALITRKSENLRRIKELIGYDLTRVYQGVETTNGYGFILGEDGPVSIPAEANNQYGETEVTPDVLTFVMRNTKKGVFSLENMFDPESSSIVVSYEGQTAPSFSGNEIVLVSNPNIFLLYVIDPNFTPVDNPGVSITYNLLPYSNPLFNAGGASIVAHQTVKNGPAITDVSAISNIGTAIGKINAVTIHRYFAAPDSSSNDLCLYRKVDFDTVDSTELIDCGLHDFQLKYIKNGNFSTKLDSVATMATSQEISHVEVTLKGATDERTLVASGNISLRGDFGGDVVSKINQVGASMSGTYQGNYMPGPGIMIANGVNPPLTIRGSIPEPPATPTGRIQIIDGLGNVIRTTDTNLPVVGISQDKKGNVYAMLASDRSTGTPQAKLIRFQTDADGNITGTSPTTTEIVANLRTINSMVFSNYVNGAGEDVTRALLVSNDTKGNPPHPAATSRKVVLVESVNNSNFNTVAEYNFVIADGANHSMMITGATIIEREPLTSSFLILTSSAIDPANNNALLSGGIFSINVNPNTLVPKSLAADNKLMAIRRIEFDGPAKGITNVQRNAQEEPNSFMITGFTNVFHLSASAMRTIINAQSSGGVQQIGDNQPPPPPPPVLKTTTMIGSQAYCGNTLIEPELSSYYKQTTGETTVDYLGPLAETVTLNYNGQLVTSSGVTPLKRDLQYQSQLDALYAAAIFATVKPDTDTKVLNRAEIRIKSNARYMGSDPNVPAYFSSVIPQHPTDPCATPYPVWEDPALIPGNARTVGWLAGGSKNLPDTDYVLEETGNGEDPQYTWQPPPAPSVGGGGQTSQTTLPPPGEITLEDP